MRRRVLRHTVSYIGKEISRKKDISSRDLIKYQIPARYVEEDGTIFLEKIDRNTGKILEKVRVGDKQWWNRVIKYKTRLKANISNPLIYKGCPSSCGLCSFHKNYTALLNIVVTNRCNLNCYYCFFYAEKAGYVYEPSLDEILKMIDSAKRFNNGKLYAVQLTGGEPTLRGDLDKIIRQIKKKGVKHIQLNTNGVRIGILYYNDPAIGEKYVKKLKKAGVNTIYLSFDGVDPKINFKNYYEVPFALEAFYRGELRSVVLVPTLINKWNFPEQVDKIIKFAASNMDVVRGVNFQPVSFVGYMTKEELAEVEDKRVTQSDLEIVIEKRLGIPRESWRPVPFVVPLLHLLGKKDLGFYNSPLCGEATYLIVDKDGKNVKFYPITDYIDIDKIYSDLKDLYRKNPMEKVVLKLNFLLKLLRGKYILKNKLPDGSSIVDLMKKLIIEKSYSAAGEIHYRLLFVGTMHFMDPFNYDRSRVMRCSIHYASPDGRVIPFCAYNVFPSVYRDNILKKYSIDGERARKKLEENSKFYDEIRHFRSKISEIIRHPIFKKRYSL